LKHKIFNVLFALVLVLSFSLVMAVPAGATGGVPNPTFATLDTDTGTTPSTEINIAWERGTVKHSGTDAIHVTTTVATLDYAMVTVPTDFALSSTIPISYWGYTVAGDVRAPDEIFLFLDINGDRTFDITGDDVILTSHEPGPAASAWYSQWHDWTIDEPTNQWHIVPGYVLVSLADYIDKGYTVLAIALTAGPSTTSGPVNVDVYFDQLIVNGNVVLDEDTGFIDVPTPLVGLPAPCIHDAVNAALAGDTILVAAGTYVGSVYVWKPLTIQGANAGVNPVTESRGPESIIDASGAGWGQNGFTVIASNVTIQGFTVYGPKEFNTAPFMIGGLYPGDLRHLGVEHVTIRNNIIKGKDADHPTWTAVYIWKSSHNLIEYNKIIGTVHRAIQIYDGSYDHEVAYIDGVSPKPGSYDTSCHFAHPCGRAFEDHQYYETWDNFQLTPVGQLVCPSQYNRIIGNEIANGRFGGIFVGAWILDDKLPWFKPGLWTDNTGTEVSGNHIHDTGDIGIGTGYSAGSKVFSGNRIENCSYVSTTKRGVGIRIMGYGATDTRIEDNDIIDSEAYGIVFLSTFAVTPPPTMNCANTSISGNTISGSSTAGIGLIAVDATNVRVNFNNIVGNAFGINNGGTGTLNATHNWWGYASGPHHPTTNLGGTGNPVSDNVTYGPWIGAGVVDSRSETTPPEEYTVDARDEADTEVIKSGTGTPTVTVAEYSSNPGRGFAGSTGKYIDVHVDDPTDVDEIEIRLYYTDADIVGLVESSLRLRWWNGTIWVACSDSGVNTTDDPPYSGYMWARITPDTTPDLADLAGAVFGGAGVPPVVGGGGGGGGGAPTLPAPPAGTTDVRGMVTTAGVFVNTVTAPSEDGLCTLTILGGTVGLTTELEPLTEITILIMHEPPSPPEDAYVISLVYDFQPSGATFEPPVTLTWSYDPADIPEGVAEEDLLIAYYDQAAGEWIVLEGCVVDPEADTVTCLVGHFTAFRAMVFIPVPAFSLSGLEVSPVEVEVGTPVTISAVVENTGGQTGSYEVILRINGVVEATKAVTLSAGVNISVTLTTAKDVPGSYSVDVNGLTGSFTVKEKPVAPAPPPPAPPVKAPIKWPVIGGIIAAVVILGLLIFFLVRRRAL